MAEKAYDATKVNTEETVPLEFKCHWKVFSEQEARQLPPHCNDPGPNPTFSLDKLYLDWP